MILGRNILNIRLKDKKNKYVDERNKKIIDAAASLLVSRERGMKNKIEVTEVDLRWESELVDVHKCLCPIINATWLKTTKMK